MDKYTNLRAVVEQKCSAILIEDVDVIRALLAERDALIHDNSEYVSAANDLATENQRLREAVTAFIEYADNHGEITFAGGGMRAVDAMNSVVRIARAALAQEQGGSDG